MNDLATIREGIKKLSHQPVMQVVAATVNSVDWTNRTCDVTCDDESTLEGVRLRAVIDDNDNKPGWCFKPKVNSYVLIALINNQSASAYVAMFTDVDSLEVNYGDTPVLVIDLTQGKITMNDGSNDGLVKIQPLITKINQLENKYNELLGLLNSHTHLCAAPSTASGVPIVLFTDTITPVTAKADLENTKVTH